MDYIKFRGKPPKRLHQEYSKFAFENFFISNRFWNTPGAPMVTRSKETNLTAQQQDAIDHLWWTFLTTCENDKEKGYMLNENPARLHADWNQSALEDRPEIPPLRAYPWSDEGSVPRPNATTSVDAGIGLMALAPPVSPPSPGYHPRDESPEPAYRSNEPGTSSVSGQVLAPRAIKTAPPVPAYPWTPQSAPSSSNALASASATNAMASASAASAAPTPIGARPSSMQRANPDEVTYTFAARDIRLRQPNNSDVEQSAPRSRDWRQRRGNNDGWNWN